MQLTPITVNAYMANQASPATASIAPAPGAAAAITVPGPRLEHAGTTSFVSKDGRYGYIDSDAFRSVFVWQSALETPDELRVGQRIEFEAGGVGWDPNHVEAVRARVVPA